MKRIIIFFLFSFCVLTYKITAQNIDPYYLFLEYSRQYNSGDFLKAEQSMYLLLDSETKISNNYKVAAYNNLGVIYNRMGKYNDALESYKLAETYLTDGQEDSLLLADIYINKGLIYNLLFWQLSTLKKVYVFI
jgi:tetratricopeptide (TPR) repeat protein